MTLNLTRPGLFITGTDTGVGKTVVTCAIATHLRRQGLRVGVCKPIATGCRHDREGLVSEDAEALAHFSDCRLPLTVINPVRYRAAMAPAVAAERETPQGSESEIDEALRRIEQASEVLLVEGIGGLLVPINERRTVLDIITRVGYPVLVVTRATLGTLNHTAMSCRLLRDAGLRVAGLVVNRYRPDAPDLVESSNVRWLAKQNEAPVLATVPEAPAVAPHEARLPPEILDAVGAAYWPGVCGLPSAPSPPRMRR